MWNDLPRSYLLRLSMRNFAILINRLEAHLGLVEIVRVPPISLVICKQIELPTEAGYRTKRQHDEVTRRYVKNPRRDCNAIWGFVEESALPQHLSLFRPLKVELLQLPTGVHCCIALLSTFHGYRRIDPVDTRVMDR